MKTLIVEDDYISRQLQEQYLNQYGPCHTAENGIDALDAIKEGLEWDQPYDLICMDIMMPELDGQNALREIRAFEESKGISSTRGVKVIMTTALNEIASVKEAYLSLCDGYLVKPIRKERLFEEIRKLQLIM